jgi:CRP/FNR family transcriptional regulator, cyclic AMP receptor protein
MKLHQRQRSLRDVQKKVKSLLFVQTKAPRELAGQKNMRKSLVKQFEGSEGRSHLIDALLLQPLVRDRDLAALFARRLTLVEVPAGTNLIEQGALDTDLFLILKGEFSIAIDGRIVARRGAGEHVGEMAVVDPRTPRSASVTASADSVVARVAEPDFSALADRYPQLWRRIALGLASRLRTDSAGDHAREKAGRAA